MFVGRRIVSKYKRSTLGCGGIGDGGFVVYDAEGLIKNARRIYIVFDNCVCKKPYSGGCNGFSYDLENETSTHFEWAESDSGEQSSNNEQPCNCNLDIIMAFGCQCGGK